ncbi:MAG: ABC transporter ATP-binding protein [Bacteroidota bacterium]
MPDSKKQASQIVDLQVVRKLAVFIKPYRGGFYLLILFTFLLGVLAPLEPYLVQLTIDRYIAAGDYTGLVHMVLLLVGLLTVQGMVQYFQTYLGDWLGQRVIKDIRIQLYTHILQLRTRFFNQTPIGRLVTRNISDTETLANVFKEGIASLMSELLQILLMMALMFYINWRLALLSLSTMPLILLVTYVFKEKIKHVFGAVRNAVAQLNSFVQERIIGMSIVQIFGREQHELAQFKALNEAHRNAGIQSVQYYARYFPLLSLINSLSISLLIWYGAKDVLQGTVTLGELVAFLMYINLLFRPLHLIADRFNTLQMGIVSTDRIMKLLENGEQMDNAGTHVPQQLRGDITFQNVWFAYEDDHYVLEDISFHLEVQKSLAIVGATGAGKSTLINLLERFYDVRKGAISIDGVNIKDYELHALRRQVGLVLQDVFLFSGSIYENITLGDPHISREQVMKATQLMGLHTFIQQLPGGYDYNVMERGMTLSMGQRQLLSFARMLVYDPSILILDEATASLDTESERLIQKAMATLMQNRTCILIAHRLATIQQADKILVLKKGKIQEEGTHETLLAQGGDYAALYQAS